MNNSNFDLSDPSLSVTPIPSSFLTDNDELRQARWDVSHNVSGNDISWLILGYENLNCPICTKLKQKNASRKNQPSKNSASSTKNGKINSNSKATRFQNFVENDQDLRSEARFEDEEEVDGICFEKFGKKGSNLKEFFDEKAEENDDGDVDEQELDVGEECHHPLDTPKLLKVGKGGLKAFIANNGENELTKHMQREGYLYWVYARVNIKDRPQSARLQKSLKKLFTSSNKLNKAKISNPIRKSGNRTVQDELLDVQNEAESENSRSEKSDSFRDFSTPKKKFKSPKLKAKVTGGGKKAKSMQESATVSILGSKKLLLISYVRGALYGRGIGDQFGYFNESSRTIENKYAMNLRMYSHGLTLKKIFKHHMYIEAMTDFKIMHPFIYSQLMNTLSNDKKKLTLVIKHELDHNVTLPFIVHIGANNTVKDLKEAIAQKLNWKLQETNLVIVKAKNNSDVLKSLNPKVLIKRANQRHEERENEIEMFENEAENDLQKRQSLRRNPSLPKSSSLFYVLNISDDSKVLQADLMLKSGDELYVERKIDDEHDSHEAELEGFAEIDINSNFSDDKVERKLKKQSFQMKGKQNKKNDNLLMITKRIRENSEKHKKTLKNEKLPSRGSHLGLQAAFKHELRKRALLSNDFFAKRKNELSIVQHIRSREHSNTPSSLIRPSLKEVDVNFSSSFSNVQNQNEETVKLKREQIGLENKLKLLRLSETLGAHFIETSDLIVTNNKPIGQGKTARVYEGLLRCKIDELDINKGFSVQDIEEFNKLAPSDNAIDSRNESELIRKDLGGKGGDEVDKNGRKEDDNLDNDNDNESVSSGRMLNNIEALEVAVKVAIKKFTCRFVTEEVADTFQQEIQALCNINHNGVVRCLGVYIDIQFINDIVDNDNTNIPTERRTTLSTADLDLAKRISNSKAGTKSKLAKSNEGFKDLQLMIVYELCSRGDFNQLRRKKDWNFVGFKTRFNMILPACEALQLLHSRNIVHRDLKSDNILVSEDFTLKIGDFGVAQILSSSHNSNSTADDQDIGGTLGYTAPELMEGKSTGNKASDIFSFGVILYELICDYEVVVGIENGAESSATEDEKEIEARFRARSSVKGLVASSVRKSLIATEEEQELKPGVFLVNLDQYLDQFVDDNHLNKLKFPEGLDQRFIDLVKLCVRSNSEDRCSAEHIVAVINSLLF